MKWTYLFIVLLVFTSCKKKKKKCSRSYKLEHPLNIYPIKETYDIGDTIWIELNLPNSFKTTAYNNFSGEAFDKTVTLDHFDFHRTFIGFSKIDLSSNTIKTGWQDFSPILFPEFNQMQQEFGMEYRYNYSSGMYHYKFGVICKSKGIFFIGTFWKHYNNEACLGFLNEQDISPDCEKEIIVDIHFPINLQNDGTCQTNYPVFEAMTFPFNEGDREEAKKYYYTFKVH